MTRAPATPPTLSPTFSPRWPPLSARYLLAEGTAAASLRRRLVDDPRLPTWLGVVGEDLLALGGDDLPWVDGVEFFGLEHPASALLTPTTWQPDLPLDWLERAWRAALPDLAWPCLLTRDGRLVPVGAAGPLVTELQRSDAAP